MKPTDLEKLQKSLSNLENSESKKRLNEISIDYFKSTLQERKEQYTDFDATQNLINSMQTYGDIVKVKINELMESICNK